MSEEASGGRTPQRMAQEKVRHYWTMHPNLPDLTVPCIVDELRLRVPEYGIPTACFAIEVFIFAATSGHVTPFNIQRNAQLALRLRRNSVALGGLRPFRPPEPSPLLVPASTSKDGEPTPEKLKEALPMVVAPTSEKGEPTPEELLQYYYELGGTRSQAATHQVAHLRSWIFEQEKRREKFPNLDLPVQMMYPGDDAALRCAVKTLMLRRSAASSPIPSPLQASLDVSFQLAKKQRTLNGIDQERIGRLASLLQEREDAAAVLQASAASRRPCASGFEKLNVSHGRTPTTRLQRAIRLPEESSLQPTLEACAQLIRARLGQGQALTDAERKSSRMLESLLHGLRDSEEKATAVSSDLEMRVVITNVDPGKLLPRLTTAERSVLRLQLNSDKPAGDVLFTRFNTAFSWKDLRTLGEQKWLNDEVINQYFQLLQQRSIARGFAQARSAFFFPTFFIVKLVSDGEYTYENVRRWTKRKCDVFGEELVFIPINVAKVHWCLCVIFVQEQRIVYYDSLGDKGTPYLQSVKRWLCDEHVDKKGTQLPNEASWRLESPERKGVPQQCNSFDCGVYMCAFANLLSAGVRDLSSFHPVDMPSVRQRIASDILRGCVGDGATDGDLHVTSPR